MEIRITFKEQKFAHRFGADLFELCGVSCSRRGSKVRFNLVNIYEYEVFDTLMAKYKDYVFDTFVNS